VRQARCGVSHVQYNTDVALQVFIVARIPFRRMREECEVAGRGVRGVGRGEECIDDTPRR